MAGPSYRSGDFWRICDRCGFRYRAGQTMRTWDGLFVCLADWETRHPQDFVKGRKDIQNVPNPRPEPSMIYVGPFEPIETEADIPLETENGSYLTLEA